MFTDLLDREVTIYLSSDAVTTDVFGNPDETLSGGTTVPARVDPEQMEETDNGLRDTRSVVRKVWVDPGTNVDGIAQVDFEGDRYGVLGEVQLFDDADGPHHIEFTIRRFLG